MDNMQIYNMGREVPKEAQKPINAGRLKGMTDINPVWRISKLTEMFGPCGIGWKYEITREEVIPGTNGEISAFVDINLYYKWEGEWSEAIPGTGGSSFVAKEKNGLYQSDECFKMALTDALSVACKALGIGADVYWAAGRSKYSVNDLKENYPDVVKENDRKQPPDVTICQCCGRVIVPVKASGTKYSVENIVEKSMEIYGEKLCWGCMKDRKNRADGS